MFLTLCAIALWYYLQGAQKTQCHSDNGRFICHEIPRLVTNDCVCDDTKLRAQSEMMCDGQPLLEMKQRRLSINDFELMNRTMSRTIPRVAAHVYNVTHTL